MFLKRSLCLLLTLGCLLGTAEAAAAAEVESGASYCFSAEDFSREENLNMAQALGYRTVFWSLAYVDWNNDSQPTAQEAMNKLLPRTHPGAVVLLHSTSRTNAEILEQLIEKWKEEGYTFGTLNELFA